MQPRTMFEKIWDSHLVREAAGEPSLIYVDLHLVHEVTSPQAYEGLRLAGRKVRRPDLTIATVDHNVPTTDRSLPIEDPISKQQIETLAENTREFGITYYDMNDENQGIVHIIGPQLGHTQPGKVIVCGDSHTATHGAFGAFALGIGTSEVEHVLATQTLRQFKPKTMEVRVDGELPAGVTAKDIILGIIGKIGTSGGAGYVVEYTGEAIRALPMEGRMTVCNMSIEAGARAGIIAPDETTFEWLRGRKFVPQGAEYDEAIERWKELATDEEAEYDVVVELDAAELKPHVTWGTNPEQVVTIDDEVPNPAELPADKQEAAERALAYMGLEAGTKIRDIEIDRVFIGSCTNSRLSDLRAAADMVRGKSVHPNVSAMVVPGSALVKWQAEQEGLDAIFAEAGFEWRAAGCSMCLGMNPDILLPQERCASTSNRNFEGRQGKGRAHTPGQPADGGRGGDCGAVR